MQKFGGVLAMMLLFSSTLYAANEPDQAKLKQVRQEIQQLSQNLSQQQTQRSNAAKQVRATELSLSNIRKNLRGLEKQSQRAEQKLQQLRKERGQLEAVRQQHQNQLGDMLRMAYMAGHDEQLKLLLNLQDPASVNRVLTYYNYLSNARLSAIKTTETNLIALRNNELAIKHTLADLTIIKTSQQKEKLALEKQLAIRNQAVSALSKEINTSKNQLARLRQDEQQLQKLLGSLKKLFADIPPKASINTKPIDFTKQKGQLGWPVKGTLLNRFGEAKGIGDLRWRGLRIAAPAGETVRAVSPGRVVFADWLSGFGLLLILDHQNGYMSLYAQNRELLKQSGDWVNVNETVGTVGDSGGQNQTALYFEIRHNGVPTDPIKWLNRQTKR
ncbi:MAG: peptidoglycan DD-metalloendopeptidase family protein [Gammaproteobacteria bacterium]|nr:peptidoglycan DD-metalloendopeptidase family protein [Gammaproteobacteria bacterium]